MNVVADLEMLQKSYSCIKVDRIQGEDHFGVNESNDHLLEEVYNQFPLRIEDYVTLYGRTTLVKEFIRRHMK